MKRYAVKEVFYTLQGEGAQTGRAAVFLRFTGCNLWTGRAADRGKGPGGCSAWCDTDFVGTDGVGGGTYTAADLAAQVASTWHGAGGQPLVQDGSFTMEGDAIYATLPGGEPLVLKFVNDGYESTSFGLPLRFAKTTD